MSITQWWVHSAPMNSFNRSLLCGAGTAPRYTQSSTVLRGVSNWAANSRTLKPCSRNQVFRSAMRTFYYRGPAIPFIVLIVQPPIISPSAEVGPLIHRDVDHRHQSICFLHSVR